MVDWSVHRRRVLLAAPMTVGLLSGCLTGESDEHASTDTEPASPDPSGLETNGTEDDDRSDDVGYPTKEFGGYQVPLVPLEEAGSWQEIVMARFVDARSASEYSDGHIAGAVHSPAPSGHPQNDPVEEWSKTIRVVTYCNCPDDALSVQRAADLRADGFSDVYALDAKYDEWVAAGYPMESGPED